MGLVQTIAMTELLAESWYEPPDAGGLHLSTLVQQLLSLIAQHGGVQPQDAYRALCSKGPFDTVSSADFADLLRSLGKRDVLMQASDGLLLLGVAGERIVNHYSFYAAFQGTEEYRLLADGRVLGTLAVDQSMVVGTLLIFGGARWKVLGVDAATKTIDLARSSSGRPPLFDGGAAAVHDVVRRRMFALYTGTDEPAYLDSAARRMLAEARAEFRRWHLDTERLVAVDGRTYLFAWAGDRILTTLTAIFTSTGLEVGTEAMTIATSAGIAHVADHLKRLAAGTPPDVAGLIDHLGNQIIDKWDELIDAPLRHRAHGCHALDVEGAWREVQDGFGHDG